MQKSFWLLISIVLFSCEKDLIVPDLGLDYYPIELGNYRVYDVEETTYLNFVATLETYQLREVFSEVIVNGTESSFLMRIEKRSTALDSWVSISSVYVRQSRHILEYRENNVSSIAMSYPVKVGRNWNGNALNNGAEAIFNYEATTEADQIKVVISDLPPNIVEKDQRFEIYEKGIGLVERNFITVDLCYDNCNGQGGFPENGRILEQHLIDYGSL